ncbi:MAG: EAL domain-containing protein [Raoultibacter sp.]
MIFIAFSAIIAIALIGLVAYYWSLENDLKVQAHTSIEEIKIQQCFNFKKEIEAETDTVVASAVLLGQLSGDRDAVLAALGDVAKTTKADALVLADRDGNTVDDQGRVSNVKGRAHFEHAMAGETSTQEPVVSLVTDEMIIPISTPIKKDGKIVGSLMGAYPLDRLNDLLLPSFEGEGFALVVDDLGDIIAMTENTEKISTGQNIFNVWSDADVVFPEGQSIETIAEQIEQGQDGQGGLSFEGKNFITHYGSVGINEWGMFVIVPEDVVLKNAVDITNRAIVLVALVITCFVLIILYILHVQTKAFKAEKESIARLEHIAYVDELTGERNYAKFKIDAQKMLDENPDTAYTIAKVDIENFKLINQVYGYEMGNKVLRAFARSLHEVLLDWGGIFSRVANDDFVLMHPTRGESQERQRHQMAMDYFARIMGDEFNYIVKFKAGQYGISQNRDPQVEVNEYYELANFAHREAKRDSLKAIVFYEDKMSQAALERKELENRMEQALAAEEFVAYLQPKYALEDESIGGAEALVRWRVSETELLFPNAFIGLFEADGFILKLDMYMLDKACKIVRGWIDSGIEPTTISVNFSRLHLDNTRFVEDICAIVDSYEVPHHYLEVEITESAIFEHLSVFETVLDQLHRAGFTLSMDDFGSGYSSLGLLKDLPVDVIKIDRSFFVSRQSESRTKTVIGMVLKMADELSIKTVAEGVEDKNQIDLLRAFGCNMVQGFYYARPMPSDEFTRKLMQERKK